MKMISPGDAAHDPLGRAALDAGRLDRSAGKDSPTRRVFGIPAADIALLWALVWRIAVRQPAALWPFCRTFYETARRNPRALDSVGVLAAFYLHLGPFAQFVIATVDRQIAAIDTGEWQPPAIAAPEYDEPIAVRHLPAA